MPVATVEDERDEVNELVELNVGRVDGVDDPAHKRQFLLIKSADASVSEADEDEAEPSEVAVAAEKALLALTAEKTAFTTVQVNAVRALAKALGMEESDLEVQPVPDETTSKKSMRKARSKGGRMASAKTVRKHEVDDEEETPDVDTAVENEAEVDDADADEDEANETEADDADDDDGEETQKASAAAANRRATARSSGPKAKLPTKRTGPPTVPRKAEGALGPKKTQKSQDDEDDLDERIALAVANAMGPAMEKLTEVITAAITPVQKNSKTRPGSKQAQDQDDVHKSAVPKFGEGLFTSVIFPDR